MPNSTPRSPLTSIASTTKSSSIRAWDIIPRSSSNAWPMPSKVSTKSDEDQFYINGLRDGIVLLDAYRQRYDGVKEKFCIEGKGLDGARTLAILDVEIADPSTGRSYPEDI